MTNFERVAERIFGIIKGAGHNLVMYTSDGTETTSPAEGRRFFVKKPNYMITLDQDTREIKLNRNRNTDLGDIETLNKHIRELGRDTMLKTTIRVFGCDIKPKDYVYLTKSADIEDVLESALGSMYGSSKTSYQRMESVKLVVKHDRPVSEETRGSRSRAIKHIFIERDGERTQFPFKNLSAARAMARHYYNGGVMEDSVGQHILSMTENMYQLKAFVNYANKSGLLNEEHAEVLEVAQEQFESLRHRIKRLSGVKTYESVRSEIEQELKAQTTAEPRQELYDLFTVKQIDSAAEQALPLVSSLLHKKEAQRAQLEEQSKQPLRLAKQLELTEDDLIEYTDKNKKVGHKLRSIINRTIEDNDLTSYLGTVAESLINGSQLKDFDRKLIKNVLENLQIGN